MTSVYRIKRAHRRAILCRQRRIAAAAVLLVLFVAWLLNMLIFNPTSSEAADDNFVYVSVHKGDTLWSIASEYKPENKDIRDFVRLIAAVNETEDNIISVGQTLCIPK